GHIQRFGCPQDVAASVLSEWGHIRCDQVELLARDQYPMTDDSNLGCWFVEQLADWPHSIQRKFLDALRGGRLQNPAEVARFVEYLPPGCHSLPVQVAAEISAGQINPAELNLFWRLAEPDTLGPFATQKIKFRL